MEIQKPTASLSLDLDNLWSYLKVHGDPGWESHPTYLPRFVPIILDLLEEQNLTISFFVVGQDAARKINHSPLRQIAEAGHEICNHSFSHESWMHSHDKKQVVEEIARAEESIQKATGARTRGFRGPGYARSQAIIETLMERGYEFDASVMPTILGPVARLYYLWTSKMSKEERSRRSNLFGKMSDGFMPLKPFEWMTGDGTLLEIPVSTMPLFRLPFHLSYLIWLSRFSKALARVYMNLALSLCQWRGVEPSYLLHPLDFLTAEDAPELKFFPGMDLPRKDKLEVARGFFAAYQKRFDVTPMGEHARRLKQRGGLRTLTPSSEE
jgi:hypothetical protein